MNLSIEIRTAFGNLIAYATTAFEGGYAKKLNEVGWFDLAMVDENNLHAKMAPDNIVYFYVDGRMDFCGFVREWSSYNDGAGKRKILRIAGPDQNDLLARRIIPVSTEAGDWDGWRAPLGVWGGYAADIMCDMVEWQLSSTADGDALRALPNVSVTSSRPYAPFIYGEWAWENLLDTLKEMSDISAGYGQPIYFDLTPLGLGASGEPRFVFRAATDYLYDNNPPVTISIENGSMSSMDFRYDYYEIPSVAYVKTDDDVDPIWVYVKDDDRVAWSPYAWSEVVETANKKSTSADHMEDQAAALLGKYNTEAKISGVITPTKNNPYGTWKMGSRVLAHYGENALNCIVESVTATITDGAKIELKGLFRST